MKSYVSNTTINIEGSKFYVRPGDMLSHDPRHGNSLAVYREGQIVKVIKIEGLAIEAFRKSKMISEVVAKPAVVAPILPPEPVPVEAIVETPPLPAVEPKQKQARKKRDSYAEVGMDNFSRAQAE